MFGKRNRSRTLESVLSHRCGRPALPDVVARKLAFGTAQRLATDSGYAQRLTGQLLGDIVVHASLLIGECVSTLLGLNDSGPEREMSTLIIASTNSGFYIRVH